MNYIFSTCQEAITYCIENKSFGIFYSENSKTSLKMHVHDCCELFFCMSDGTNFIINDKIYDVKKGDVFIINPFEAHKVSATGKAYFNRYSIHIDPTFLYSNSDGTCNLAEYFFAKKQSNCISLSKCEFEEFSLLLKKLNAEYDYCSDFHKKICLIEILLKINRLFSKSGLKSTDTYHLKNIEKAVNYIDLHFAENITLTDIAKNSYLSVTQLCRIFKNYCSTTVMKYLTSKRIAAAKKMLADGKSVTDVAFACGFNDYANFIRTFKNIVGTSPGKYKTNSQEIYKNK